MASEQVHANKGDKDVPLGLRTGLGHSPILRDRPLLLAAEIARECRTAHDAVDVAVVPHGCCARVAVLDRLPARRHRHALTPSSTGVRHERRSRQQHARSLEVLASAFIAPEGEKGCLLDLVSEEFHRGVTQQDSKNRNLTNH